MHADAQESCMKYSARGCNNARAEFEGKCMKQPEEAVELATLPASVAKEVVHLGKLFSDETRLQIVHYLMQQEELNVRTLCKLLGQSQPAVSHHLALLRVDGMIECRRSGKHNFYRLVNDRVKEFIEMIFSAAPNQPSLIGFDTFTLNYQPAEEEAAVDSA